ncbi:nuclease-related domain-containing protein [Bacillus andreraoultii]|uniref:nuclease-related domain-containing protein n=1 Tax=Bacillus andreraoultii TaxID=1499685 RepID=UPI0005399FFC
MKGNYGKIFVGIKLKKLVKDFSQQYHVFHNLYIPKRDFTYSQIEHVIVSQFGIYVIKTKNSCVWLFGDEQQKNWTQVLYNKRSKFYNSIW